MPKKLKYEYVKEFIENEGFKLLSTSYKNNHSKLEVQCPKNKDHIYKVTFNSFKSSGSRCPYCNGNKKHTYENVKEFIENEGYKLLSTSYKGVNSKLEVQCSKNKNHIYKVTFNSFKNSGSRCPYCDGNKKHTYEYVREFIEKEGYKLLSTSYKNIRSKLEVQCPKNKDHIYKVTFNNFKSSGSRCPYCNGNKKHTYENVKEFIEKEGFKLLSTSYKGVNSKLEVQCPKNHIYKVTFHNFKNSGSRCPYCNSISKTSKQEKEVKDFIYSIYRGKVLENDYSLEIINPKTSFLLELDVYLPEIKFAIEFNGSYWHDPILFPNQKYKDKQKVIQCKKKNVELMVINENEWNLNPNKIKDKIVDRIRVLSNKYKLIDYSHYTYMDFVQFFENKQLTAHH